MTTKAEAFQDLAFLVSLLKEGHPEYRPSFDRLRDFINSVPEWKPIEEYDEKMDTVFVTVPQLQSGLTMAYREKGVWLSIFDGLPFGPHVLPPRHFMALPKPPITGETK